MAQYLFYGYRTG